jgi:hypothetical protein
VLGKQIRNDSASIAARQDQREEQLNSRRAALAKRLHEIGKQQWKKGTDLVTKWQSLGRLEACKALALSAKFGCLSGPQENSSESKMSRSVILLSIFFATHLWAAGVFRVFHFLLHGPINAVAGRALSEGRPKPKRP